MLFPLRQCSGHRLRQLLRVRLSGLVEGAEAGSVPVPTDGSSLFLNKGALLQSEATRIIIVCHWFSCLFPTAIY